MLNGIWAGMVLLSVLYAAAAGNLNAVSAAIGDGAQNAAETVFLLLGGICLWSGLMKIAEHAGITDGLARLLRPVLRKLFPEYAGNSAAEEKIAMNIAANMFGMGNAATPSGLAAMDEMQRLSPGKGLTPGMILFTVMNTAAFQFVPSSVVILRGAYGSAQPYDIMPCIWMVSLASLFAAVAACRWMERLWHR